MKKSGRVWLLVFEIKNPKVKKRAFPIFCSFWTPGMLFWLQLSKKYFFRDKRLCIKGLGRKNEEFSNILKFPP